MEGEEGGAEGLLSHPTQSTQQFIGAGCNFSAWFLPEVFKRSYHKQLTEFAFKFGKQGLTNLMQNVMSRPAWLLLVTPIFFYLSQFPLRAVGFCHACSSASITGVTAAKKTFSLLLALAFHFLPWSAPCSKLALSLKRQLRETNKQTAGLRNNPTK